MLNYISAAQAVTHIRSGERVFIHGAAMTPLSLIAALCTRKTELQGIELVHIHTEGMTPYTGEDFYKSFRVNSCFVGGNVREAVQKGNADYIPVFLSEIPLLFRRGVLPIDVALIQVSAPDKHGFCSMGASVDIALSAVQTARLVIAEVNTQAPRSHGSGIIHVSKIDHLVSVDRPIYAHPPRAISGEEQKIGKFVAGLVEDGATLQMGIGGVPDAVLAELGGHKNLGIHTEMFSDGLIPLIEKGVVTNSMKKVSPGKTLACFVAGSQKVYDFLDDNPTIEMQESSYTNDTRLIRKNPKVTAINSAIEVDLTGQVCADTIGTRQYSGVGGQMDFIRGAALSEGGKPIIAMSTATRKGQTKIVPMLKQGAGITTTRAHVHYIVTEYGIANLYGKNLRQRAKALIEIAHPDHREALEKAAHERFKYL